MKSQILPLTAEDLNKNKPISKKTSHAKISLVDLEAEYNKKAKLYEQGLKDKLATI